MSPHRAASPHKVPAVVLADLTVPETQSVGQEIEFMEHALMEFARLKGNISSLQAECARLEAEMQHGSSSELDAALASARVQLQESQGRRASLVPSIKVIQRRIMQMREAAQEQGAT